MRSSWHRVWAQSVSRDGFLEKRVGMGRSSPFGPKGVVEIMSGNRNSDRELHSAVSNPISLRFQFAKRQNWTSSFPHSITPSYFRLVIALGGFRPVSFRLYRLPCQSDGRVPPGFVSFATNDAFSSITVIATL
jgi:hypothetical protein